MVSIPIIVERGWKLFVVPATIMAVSVSIPIIVERGWKAELTGKNYILRVSIPIIVERGWKKRNLSSIHFFNGSFNPHHRGAWLEAMNTPKFRLLLWPFQSPSSWSVAGSTMATLNKAKRINVSIPIIVERGWKRWR